MKKTWLVLAVAVLLQIPALAANNVIRINGGLPRLGAVEYERKLNNVFPNLSVFANYGGGSVKLEDSTTDLKGYNLGARYKLPFIGYIGVGYGSLKADYSYTATKAVSGVVIGNQIAANGDISGLYLEYGKEFGLGPIVFGGNVYYIMGKPSLSGTNKTTNTSLNQDQISEGLATVDGLPGASIYLGFSF